MAYEILQANINHCAAAQDLLMQSMAQWSIEVAVVSEPYFVPPRDNWTGDLEDSVAIVRSDGSAFSPLAASSGYVAVHWREYILIGVYFSPNKSLANFEAFLDGVGRFIESLTRPVLIVGDFNAKSIVWGSPATDARGRALEGWMAMTGLELLNRGSINTCVRHNGGSIVDLSFATSTLARRVNDWRVVQEMETLSDHLYIRFSVSTTMDVRLQSDMNGQLSSLLPRWSLVTLDREALEVASMAQAWVVPRQGIIDVDEECDWLGQALSQICDAAMARSKPRPPRRQVYWWSQDIAILRSSCILARRQYTRHMRRRLRNRELDEQLYATYRACVVTLQKAISTAKKKAKTEMLESLSNDPWGRPYKMVREKLRPWAPPLTETLQPQLLDDIVSSLFPSRVEFQPPDMGFRAFEQEDEAPPLPISQAEFDAAVAKISAKRKAPGPDGVHSSVLAVALKYLGSRLKRLLNTCLETGQFPKCWKNGKLILIKKAGRSEDSPSAYRPIVLLNEADKLFEGIIADRLTYHLDDKGPNLSENQFGFRKGRSTVDAILRVKARAEEIVTSGSVLMAISLDISNAFNTLPWACIKEALNFHAVPQYLKRVLEAYLSERSVEYPIGRGQTIRKEMSRGVPQGSVLGPLLWNIGFDWILRGTHPRGTEVICYADDTLVMAEGKSHDEAAGLLTELVNEVIEKIAMLGLRVALEKSTAICFHGPRRAPPRHLTINIGGVSVRVESHIKYLGLVLDSRWSFRDHFSDLAPRLLKTAMALKRLLPNIGGPHSVSRRLYSGVVRSMALYGAPVWAEALTEKTIAHLRRPQRVMAIGIIRGYRTISFEAACLLAGSPPWDLEAELYCARYEWRAELHLRGEHPPPREVEKWMDQARLALFERWSARLAQPRAGSWTVEAVRPFLREWVEREHGSLSFRLVQVLSGHGCFGRYLHRIAGREPTPACHHCNCPEDTAQHTLGECPAWTSERLVLVAAVGEDLSLPAVVNAMVGSETSWRAVDSFCEKIILRKEAAERLREATSDLAIRRRRVRRRERIPHALLQPP